ncbi:sugar-binding transcriptional regulator [Eubacteriales bacterium OttesenSCG-928-K08]|nr:sugar-binding transcriptional regulator [Eubacteriales bacterium OttesenSCG-928-K08]
MALAQNMRPRDIRQNELMIQVARMYYIDNLSQAQIAQKIEMSRSNVSRILQNCKEAGIVEIRLHDQALRTWEIKRRLIDRFSLKDAVIAPRGNIQEGVLNAVSQIAADYVEDLLRDDMTIGIGWGSTIHRLVNMLKPSSYHGTHVIQLVGGTNLTENYADSVQLALDFARKTGAVPHILNAPLLVSSKEVRDIFIEENSIRHHLELTSGIDAAIATISTNAPDRSTLVSAGYLTREQTQALCNEGLFTHMLGQHIDEQGVLANIPLNDRVVGINLNTFKRIPLRIGVACGEYKARQIAAALKGGYINVLITDELTAMQVEKAAN